MPRQTPPARPRADRACGPAKEHPRGGFALPIALFALLVTSLLAAIVLDGALRQLRLARGELAAAGARAAAESALSGLLSSRPDSATLARPRGSLDAGTAVAGAETTRTAVQWLGGGTVRMSAAARAWFGGVRADAEVMVLARIVPDPSGAAGSLRYRRLPGWWWSQLP